MKALVQIVMCSAFSGVALFHAEPTRATTGTTSAGLVFGADGRRDVIEHPDPSLRAFADARSVALVPKHALAIEGAKVTLSAPSLASGMDVCSNEPFAAQPMLAECSGTWLGENLVLTAGHCVDEVEACQNLYFVFGYAVDEAGTVSLDRERIFECSRVVTWELSSFNAAEQYDYAVVELDRPVPSQAEPLVVRRDLVAPDEPLVLIGNGLGLPTKIDDRASAVYGRPETQDYFEARFDNFHRGSGSGVFDARRRLVGIAVRGGVDFDGGTDCLALRRVPEEHPHAEEATYAARALELSGFAEWIETEADAQAAESTRPDAGCSVGRVSRRPGAPAFLLAMGLLLCGARRTPCHPARSRKNQSEEP